MARVDEDFLGFGSVLHIMRCHNNKSDCQPSETISAIHYHTIEVEFGPQC